MGDGVTGPRARWLYVVPSDRTSYFSTPTSSGKTREWEMRENIEFIDDLMSYATGPWREQHFRWYCSGVIPVIEELVIEPVGSDNEMTFKEIDAALRASVYKDDDLHPLWLNLGPDDCVAFVTGSCDLTPFILRCAGPRGAGVTTESNYAFMGDVLFGDEAANAVHKYTAAHETFHCVGAPDLNSDQDTHDLMSGFNPQPGSSCELVQLDCNKDQWYSSLLAMGGSVPQWAPHSRNSRADASNSATSIYLTSITPTRPTVYCDSSATGAANMFDEARDVFKGGPGRNYISLLDGDDRADTGGGNDKACGGDGSDYLSGQAGDDVLVGAGGSDKIHGGTGDDVFYDGYGSDKVVGGGGVDILYRCLDGARDRVSEVEIIRDGDHCRGWNFQLEPEVPLLYPSG